MEFAIRRASDDDGVSCPVEGATLFGQRGDEDTLQRFWVIELTPEGVLDLMQKEGRIILYRASYRGHDNSPYWQWRSLPVIVIYDDWVE